MIRVLAFTCLAGVAANTARADTIHVPADQPTIQDAIDVAQDQDTIVVAANTYVENLIIINKAITITSTDPTDPIVVAATIIDGSDLWPVVTFSGLEGSNTVLTGFTITNGYGTYGGGISGNGTLARILNCVVTLNVADHGGGVYDCDGEIADCDIIQNTDLGLKGALYRCDGTIRDCTISNNTGTGLYDCQGSISGCAISGNSEHGLSYCDGPIYDCTISGPGTYGLYNCDGNISYCTVTAFTQYGLYGCNGSISNCTVTGNTDSGFGFCDSDITRCIVSGNGDRGLEYCDGNITYCTIVGNFHGGMSNCDGTVWHCQIADNTTSGDGGGLCNCRAAISYCVVSGNSASRGGGIFNAYTGWTEIRNCVFSGNYSSSSGGGLHLEGGQTVENCTIVGNLAGGGYGGIWSTSGSISNSIIWSNRAVGGNHQGSVASAQYCCIEGGGGGTGCISTMPIFVDAGSWDTAGTPGDYSDDTWIEGNYRLTGVSLCIDTGDPAFVPGVDETDLDGHARVLCAGVDMGAYEFGIGDYDCDRAVNLADFASWPACMTGPDAGPYGAGCEAFDFEFDDDVDLADFAAFQQTFES